MGRKGFTLVEILVVLVIVGILVSLILPNTLKAIHQANVKECAADIRSINSAIQLCFTQHRDWSVCNNQQKLIDGQYIDAELTCPITHAAYSIKTVADGGNAVDTAGHFSAWPNVNEHD